MDKEQVVEELKRVTSVEVAVQVVEELRRATSVAGVEVAAIAGAGETAP